MVVQPLLRFSLAEHDVEERTLSVRRMVQAVVRDVGGEAEGRLWVAREIVPP